MFEAIRLCEEIAGKKLVFDYSASARLGDHVWYVSDVRKFQRHYPEWQYRHDLRSILLEIYAAQTGRAV